VQPHRHADAGERARDCTTTVILKLHKRVNSGEPIRNKNATK
jgi:hypothetical protein